jgi:(p)ppGpp synthase/HD superfamily hydrolase
MLSELTGEVAKLGLNIGNFSSKQGGQERQMTTRFQVEVPDLFVLARLMRRLEKVPGVMAVSRV